MTSDRFMTCYDCGNFHGLGRADKSLVIAALCPSTSMDAGWESMRRLAPIGICEAACDGDDAWNDVLVSKYWESVPCGREDWVPMEDEDDEV